MVERKHRLGQAIRGLMAMTSLTALLISAPASPARAGTSAVTNANDSGAGSLRQAVMDAPPGATITFDPSLAGDTIALASEISLDKEVTIDGSALASHIRISGGGAVRVFTVASSVPVTLDHLDITDGLADDGGAIHSWGVLTVTNSSLFGNQGQSGGAIHAGRSLAVYSSTIESNDASGDGGGIFFWPVGNLEVANCTLANNSSRDGAGIYGSTSGGSGGAVTISGSTLRGNIATRYGGGLSTGLDTSVRILGSSFIANHADAGGGLYNGSSANLARKVTVARCTFADNGAERYGGAIYNRLWLEISDSTFSANKAPLGGGIYALGTFTASRSTFAGNRATGHGGAIYNGFQSVPVVSNSTFTGNDALVGGAIFNRHDAEMTISASTFSGNQATSSYGAGIHNGGALHLMNTAVANGANGPDCASPGTLVTNAGNLVGDGTCEPALTGDPLLGPLASHGGPTQTMALGIDSPAIDAGDDSFCEPVDQRGLDRPQGARCDIGAYEVMLRFAQLPLVMR